MWEKLQSIGMTRHSIVSVWQPLIWHTRHGLRGVYFSSERATTISNRKSESSCVQDTSNLAHTASGWAGGERKNIHVVLQSWARWWDGLWDGWWVTGA